MSKYRKHPFPTNLKQFAILNQVLNLEFSPSFNKQLAKLSKLGRDLGVFTNFAHARVNM